MKHIYFGNEDLVFWLFQPHNHNNVEKLENLYLSQLWFDTTIIENNNP